MIGRGLAIVWAQRAMMLSGLAVTAEIVAVSAVLALALGLLLFVLVVRSRGGPLAVAISWLIDLMRCVPFMLFCYLVYYGLPYCGVLLDGLSAGIFALTVYNAAYFAELLRGSWTALPREQIEAGSAFGFHGWRLIRHVVLPPVVMNAVPMLGNQMIQIIKDSAFLIIIAVHELTYAANEVQATFYVPFASFVAAIVLYWLLCLAVEGGVRAMVGRAEVRR
jgi:polar amino acid transport system permease protein